MEKYKMNNVEIFQPVSGLSVNFETTYTEDSDRAQTGAGNFSPMFTVESFGYAAQNIPLDEMSKILQIVAKGLPFNFHYYSPYYNQWRNSMFYVGRGSLSIGVINNTTGLCDSLEFNIVGVNPI